MEARTTDELERPYNWRPVARPSKRRSKGRIALLTVCVLLTGFIVMISWAYHEIHKPQNASAKPFPFIVRKGDTFTSIAERLSKEGILHNTTLFELDARIHSLGSHLEAGTYRLQPNNSIDQMLATLSSQSPLIILVTVPEGLRAEEVAHTLGENNIDGKQFLYAIRHGQHKWLGFHAGIPKGRSLNGFLFPATYKESQTTTGWAMAFQMAQHFGLQFTRSMRAQAAHLGYTPYQIVTLASIVERETAVQRKLVASVYYNRLRSHMLLQADPTVQYAMGTHKDWWPTITQADERTVKSPYNTYIHPGLPPGPISNPGLNSINADSHPAKTNYYYFVAKCGTKYSVFAKNLAQQNANVARYGCH